MDTLLPLVIVFLLVKVGNQDGHVTYNEDNGHRTPVLQNTTLMSELSGKDSDAPVKIEECPALFCWRLINKCDGNCTVDGRICGSTLCSGIYQQPNGPTIPTAEACDCRPKCRCYGYVDQDGFVDVILSFQNILALPSSVISNIPWLRYLYIDNNILTSLYNNTFNELPMLSKLNLSHNMITSIHRDTFNGLSKLYDLDLDNNMITSIHGNIFNGLPMLSNLNLGHNMITSLYNNTFNELPMLSNLNLGHNMITSIHSDTFNGLSKLYDLDLDNNMITSIHGNTFNGLPMLSKLNLNHNMITSIHSDTFNGLPKLYYLDLDNNMITSMHSNTFNGLSGLMFLDLHNNMITYIHSDTFNGLSKLNYLNLQNTMITSIHSNTFYGLFWLMTLDLHNNMITSIHSNTFNGLSELSFLYLHNNTITSIHSNTFNGLSKLHALYLHNNSITYIHSNTFSDTSGLELLYLNDNHINKLHRNIFMNLSKLELLDLSNNDLTYLSQGLFSNLGHLEKLNIMGNPLFVTERMFDGLNNLEQLFTDSYLICCVKPKSIKQVKCAITQNKLCMLWYNTDDCNVARNDQISSCSDLIRSDVLRTFLWIFTFCSLFGNAVVMFYRLLIDRDNMMKSYSIFVLNLSVSDFFMGVYMLIIGAVDASFKGKYAWNAQIWQGSIWCTIAGVLSTISSEMSTFLVLIVSIDRFIVIVFPLSGRRITWRQAICVSTILWVISITIALIPHFYYEGKYYSQSGVCLALPLTTEHPPGTYYSFSMFIVLNTVIFIVVLLAQILIFKSLRASGRIASTQTHRREMAVARTLFFVVATDFCCWVPIGVMGVMARCGVDISPDIYSWVMIFILPINAAVNPFLYTISYIWRKRRNVPRPIPQTPIRQPRATPLVIRESPAATPPPADTESPAATPLAVRESLAATPPAVRESLAAILPVVRESLAAIPPAVRESPEATLSPAARESPEATPLSNREFPVVSLPPDEEISL